MAWDAGAYSTRTDRDTRGTEILARAETHAQAQVQPLRPTPTPTTTEHKEAAVKTPAAGEPAPKSSKKKKKNRCAFGECKRKVGLMGGFECRCEFTFCGEHRLPHDHNCEVDVKKLQQDKVTKENPLIEHHKFEKI